MTIWFTYNGQRYAASNESIITTLERLREEFDSAQDSVPYGTRADQRAADERTKRFMLELGFAKAAIGALATLADQANQVDAPV